jgi:predicted NBD/HSP70 family sugar kinase
MSTHYWGIDLGGTKIEGVILQSTTTPAPLCRIRINTEADKGYQHIVERIGLLVEQMSQKSGLRPETIGMGTPGVLDSRTRTLKNSNIACLLGQPLQQDLEKTLKIPFTLANDANCFALAEARLGAAQGAETVFGVIMGTGVGGGVVVQNRALYGCQGIAGEWGHNILDPGGPECYCGRKGCVETFLSGPFLQKYYAALSGQALSLQEIVRRHARGDDPHARATMEHLISCFGKALAGVINILDPHVVVLGGGVSNIDLLYTEGVGEVQLYVFNDRLETRIVKYKLGDSAGVFGAAMLVA